MSIGFVDPAFFQTIRVGSAESIPEWAREGPIDVTERISTSMVNQALNAQDTSFHTMLASFRSNPIARVFFSHLNLQWCQIRIVEKIKKITGRRVGTPNRDNLIELMSLVWTEALQLSFVQTQRDVRDAVSKLDLNVIERATNDMLIGIRAQSAYIKNVSEAPMYDDPSLNTAYVGGTKGSAGTLSNSSILPDAGDVQAFGKVQSSPTFKLKAMNEPLF